MIGRLVKHQRRDRGRTDAQARLLATREPVEGVILPRRGGNPNCFIYLIGHRADARPEVSRRPCGGREHLDASIVPVQRLRCREHHRNKVKTSPVLAAVNVKAVTTGKCMAASASGASAALSSELLNAIRTDDQERRKCAR